MSTFFVAPIVEGHGEVEAVPVLLRRLLWEVSPEASLRLNPPLRVKASSFFADERCFARYVELAVRKARQHPRSSVLILLDCEDECPGRMGPDLAARAAFVAGDFPITIALAHREYETWFLAAARSLRGTGGLPADLQAPPDPESIRDAKGWLGDGMPVGYNPVNDQPAFTARFSFEAASSVPSFDRLRRRLHRLFAP